MLCDAAGAHTTLPLKNNVIIICKSRKYNEVTTLIKKILF